MPFDPWMIDASGGTPSYAAQEVRVSTVVPFVAGAGASLGVRSGVRPSGSGTDLLVQVQASPNMSVLVNPGACVVQGAISATQGAYTWALDTSTTLTVAAAHATLTRTDLVAVRIRDANVDTSGQRDASVAVITGTAGGGVPSLPTDATYMTLAQITVRSVSAGGGTVVAGDVADKRPLTAATGGLVVCTSTTRPTSPAPFQLIGESDTGLVRQWDGATWRLAVPYRQVQTLTGTAASVTFSGIPTTLREIAITYTARADGASNNVDLGYRVNNDAGNAYRFVHIFEQLSSSSGTPQSFRNLNSTSGRAGTIPSGGAAAGLFGNNELRFTGWDSPHSGWLNSRGYGGYLDASGDVLSTFVSKYSGVGPYNRIDVFPIGANLVSGSEFLLLGWE